MPARSGGGQPARPTPEAATPPPSPLPEVLPPQTHPRSEAEVRDRVLNPAQKERRRGLALYESLSESDALPLCALRNVPQHAATPRTPALLCTDSLGDTDTGGRGGRGGCCLVAPSLCRLSGPFCDRSATEGTAERMEIHTQLLSFAHTDMHITDCHISRFQRGEQIKSKQRGVNLARRRRERQQ